VKERLGLSPTGAGHYDLNCRAGVFGLDTTHFVHTRSSTRPWTDDQLRAAADGAGTRLEVLERLHVPIQSKFFKKLDRDLEKLDLKAVLTGRIRRTRRRWSDDQLRLAVAGARGVASTIRALGLVAAGGNYDHVQRAFESSDSTLRIFRARAGIAA